MKQLTFGILSIMFLTFSSCKKDNSICTSNEEFCALVQLGNFDGTGEFINTFLKGVNGSDSQKKLEVLEEWLNCMSCVEKSKILCNSCIETYPEQSEFSVEFLVNGQKESKILDIRMSVPMEFARYH